MAMMSRNSYIYFRPRRPSMSLLNLRQSGKTFDVLDEQLKPLADILSEVSKAEWEKGGRCEVYVDIHVYNV